MASYSEPLIGGLIVGLSSVLLMLLLGRIAGISSIFWKVIQPGTVSTMFSKDRLWPLLFVAGLPLGAWLASFLFDAAPDSTPSSHPLLIVLSGGLVGFGAKLSGGCTSGHGVCGIGRFSARSIVATCVFMCAAMVTVLITHTLGR